MLPPDQATAVGHANIVALLLMSRADPEYRSSQGMVARQMALEHTALLLDLWLGSKVSSCQAPYWIAYPQVIDTASRYATNM